MKNKPPLFVILFLMIIPSAFGQLYISKEVRNIGPITKVDTVFGTYKTYIGKTPFYVESTADNIIIESSENETINFERYNQQNSIGLINYFNEYCGVDEDGWSTYEGGWEFSVNNETILVTEGYCNSLTKIRPTVLYDVLLLNNTGLLLRACVGISCSPLEYYTVKYDIHDTPKNYVVDLESYSNKSIIYKLPHEAYVWWESSILETKEDDNKNINVTIDYRKIGKNRVLFIYGTDSQFSDYQQSMFGWFGIFIAILIFSFGFFEYKLFSTRKDKSVFKRTLIITILFFLISYYLLLFKMPKWLGLLPPFYIDFRLYISYSMPIVVILFILSFYLMSSFYAKCDICRKILKRKGLKEHMTKVHNEDHS